MKSVAVFSFDAGGSALIAAIEEINSDKFRFFNFSQKRAPFANILKNDKITFIDSDEEVFMKLQQIQPNLIITGTSWQTNMHDVFLRFGKEHSIPTVSFVDHWTSYKSRFENHLPDYLATFDERSTTIAKKEGFENVVEIKNYHLQKLQREYSTIKTKEKDQILFLSEPTFKVAQQRYGNGRHWGFDETDVFKEVLDFAKKQKMELLVRLHPSDTKTRYLELVPNIRFSKNTLLEDIAASKFIVGIDTVALYYAYSFGKKTVALMPTQKRKVVVPLPTSNILSSLHSIKIDNIQTLKMQSEKTNGIDFDDFVVKVLL